MIASGPTTYRVTVITPGLHRQTYDACVRRADEYVSVLLNTLAELGVREEIPIIVTADHGKEFRDHGGIGHGQGLFEELIHVPMVIWVPGRGWASMIGTFRETCASDTACDAGGPSTFALKHARRRHEQEVGMRRRGWLRQMNAVALEE